LRSFQLVATQGSSAESSSRLERPESEADHQPPPHTKVRNEWMYTSTTAYGFMACTGELREKERQRGREKTVKINPLNPELNPIC